MTAAGLIVSLVMHAAVAAPRAPAHGGNVAVGGVATTHVKPMRGWMTWERYTCETDCATFPETCISEHLIRSTADAMVSEGLVAAGYDYIQIDDCWAAQRRSPQGAIVPDPVRFPSGMKALADYVHAKGMKLGLYGDIGSATCGGFIGFNISAVPDAVADAKLQADVDMMTSWGMDSLKVDGCNADAHTMNVTYPKLGAALRRAAAKAQRPAPWYSCSWPDYVGAIVCNGNRSEPCVPLGQIAQVCNSGRLWDDISDSWNQPQGNGAGVKNIIDYWALNPQFATVQNGPTAGRYYNDPDQLLIGNNGLSRTESEVQMGMWALWSAPMVLSVELRGGALAADMKAILLNKEVLAVGDDALALQATRCVSPDCSHGSVLYGGSTSVWNKTLADGSGAHRPLSSYQDHHMLLRLQLRQALSSYQDHHMLYGLQWRAASSTRATSATSARPSGTTTVREPAQAVLSLSPRKPSPPDFRWVVCSPESSQ